MRKQRDAENLAAAETRLHEATERHAALPVPDRIVTEDEVSAARNAAAGMKLDLEGIERDIQRAHGALEQVGGAVARERLRDATEAFELAERQEREIEAEYEAWKLLLDQMKEADAAQASNLGQALVPAIAGRFQELTQRRYETVQLTAQLATEGIMVSGALRPADADIGRHPRAIVHLVPAVAGGVFAHGDCPGRPARSERRQPDGLVSRVAHREGPQLPDCRLYMPA